MPGKTLATPSSPYTQVFRAIVAILGADPAFRRIVGQTNFRSWSGVDTDRTPMTATVGAPVVRLTPKPADQGWYSPDSQRGKLAVAVDLVVASNCIDDVGDLWDLIVNVLSPTIGRGIANTLKQAGAQTGEIVFMSPAVDETPEMQANGSFYATGHFQLDVMKMIDP